MKRQGISRRAKRLLDFLLYYTDTNRTPYCQMRIADMAKQTESGKETTKLAIDELVDQGLIVRQAAYGTAWRYYPAVNGKPDMIPVQKKPESKMAGRPREAGYVYVIEGIGLPGYYKIGRARDIDHRIHTLGVLLPFDIDAVAIIETDDRYRLETELHTKFGHRRVRGEWFALTNDDIEYLKLLSEVSNHE